MPYTKFNSDWKDAASATGGGDESTPITAAAMDYIEDGLVDATASAENAQDGVTTVSDALSAHTGDTSDAHDASAISVADAGGLLVATEVEAALAELAGQSFSVSAVTALPGSPVDGDLIRLTDSLTAPTYSWLLQYEAQKSSNKWQFIGGSAIYAEVVAEESTTSTSYVALGTAGPSVAVPVAGDYFVATGARITESGGANSANMSYDIGGTGAVDADAVGTHNAGTASPNGTSAHRVRKKAGLTAVTLTAKYKTSSNTGIFDERWISITPIAIGG